MRTLRNSSSSYFTGLMVAMNENNEEFYIGVDVIVDDPLEELVPENKPEDIRAFVSWCNSEIMIDSDKRFVDMYGVQEGMHVELWEEDIDE